MKSFSERGKACERDKAREREGESAKIGNKNDTCTLALTERFRERQI